jgi:2-keto-3-deoxy-L-fuconate dehydrogenase
MHHGDFPLQGKTAPMTAAAQGIGRASVLVLATPGSYVVATEIQEEKQCDSSK